ncbi:MAG: ABC transporter permease [Chloroflexi bacterium]|nr:ABC transporter permease [Chloroflexota bacterium]
MSALAVDGTQPSTTRSRWLEQHAPALLVFVIVIGAWELLVFAFNVQVYLLPAPHIIAQTLVEQASSLLDKGLYTFREALLGYLIGCSLGLFVAIVASRWSAVADALVPYAIATNAVPIIALAPLSIVWFGIDEGSKVAIVAIMTFFPMMLSTFRGLTTCAPASLELMHSYAASPREVYAKLRLPNALPYIFNALKINSTLAMIGAVVGEFFGGPAFRALGVFIKSENAIAHNKEAWAAIVIACVLGIGFYGVVMLIEKWLMPWHLSQRESSR